jgi:rubrerythrin
MSDQPPPEKPSYPNAAADRLILQHAQNWVCDTCTHAWFEADAYVCPICSSSALHRWGERESEL